MFQTYQGPSKGAVLSLKITFAFVYFLLACTVCLAVISGIQVVSEPSWVLAMVFASSAVIGALLAGVARHLVLTIRWLTQQSISDNLSSRHS